MSETEKELISTIKIAIIRAIVLMDEEKLLELVKKQFQKVRIRNETENTLCV